MVCKFKWVSALFRVIQIFRQVHFYFFLFWKCLLFLRSVNFRFVISIILHRPNRKWRIERIIFFRLHCFYRCFYRRWDCRFWLQLLNVWSVWTLFWAVVPIFSVFLQEKQYFLTIAYSGLFCWVGCWPFVPLVVDLGILGVYVVVIAGVFVCIMLSSPQPLFLLLLLSTQLSNVEFLSKDPKS